MKPSSLVILCVFGHVTSLPSVAGDLTALPTVPFANDSLWKAQAVGNSANILRAGRLGGQFILEGTGLAAAGATPERIEARQATRFFNRGIRARLKFVTSTSATAEAGIALEATQITSSFLGMRLLITPGGTLRMEGSTTSANGQPWSSTPITGLTFPLWLRVSYPNGGVQAHYSQDGTTWQAVGTSMPLTFPSGDAMLLCASGSATQPACAVFDNVAIAAGDADENGLLDGEELKRFGRLIGSEAELDADGDGRSYALEWQQGTNPMMPDEPLCLCPQPRPDGKLDLVAGAYQGNFTLRGSSNLVNWSLVHKTKGTDARGVFYTVSAPVTGTRMFWRGDTFPTSDPPLP